MRALVPAAPPADKQAMRPAVIYAKAALGRALALALPPRCPGCGAVTGADHRFCAPCWAGLRFLAPPWCAGCCLPFGHDRGVGVRCAACLAEPPAHAGVRAAVAYGDVARGVALRLKYGGRTAFAETAGRLMRRHLPDRCDLVVPVPLHRRRLWTRGFNQAALIARAMARADGVAVDPFVLERTRATPPLRGLSRRERARAVRAAFRVPPEGRDRLRGRHVALVDDVYTSGATAGACVAALLRAGAASVTVLCWARVLDDAVD